MAPIPKVSKDMILEQAFKITEKKGIEALNARGLAKELNCSTQPILYYYKNMEELKKEVMKEASKNFYTEIFERNYDRIVYKDFGINYIKMAKNKPILFKLLFANDINEALLSYMNLTGPLEKVKSIIANQTTLPIDKALEFHKRMWLYTNGIANLIANDIYKFNDDEIEELMKEQYISQLLLEIQKGNIKKEVLENMKKHNLKRIEKN